MARIVEDQIARLKSCMLMSCGFALENNECEWLLEVWDIDVSQRDVEKMSSSRGWLATLYNTAERPCVVLSIDSRTD